MRNLAGNKQADEFIQEELLLANIDLIRGNKSEGEVPYTISGKLGDWSFERAWTYWMASAPDGKGLILDIATAMHNTPYPIIGNNQPKIYGKVIRVTGNCTGPHPTEWAFPTEEALNKWSQNSGRDWGQICYRDLAKLCNEGTITGQRFINSYHIDTQLGLSHFSSIISAALD